MGFKSNSIYNVYKYKIDMEEVISSIYYLILEISSHKGTEDKFYVWGADIFNVKRIYGQDSIPESEDERLFLGKLANCLTEDFYETSSSLNGSNIVYMHNKRNTLICHRSSNKPQDILKNWLKKFSPVEKLFSFIVDEGILILEKKMSSLITEIHYSRAVSAHLVGPWDACVFPKEWMMYDNVKRELIDCASIWIDSSYFNDIGEFEEFDAFELSIPDNFLGLEMGEYIFPMSPVDGFIAKEHFSDYFFTALTNIYSPDKKDGDVDRPLEDAFLDAFKGGEFGKLLSFLNFNLYISESDMVIKEDYVSFFEEVVGLEEIEKLDAYQLYVSIPSDITESNSKTMLGIYEKEKKGSEYNILNWITATNKGMASHIGGKVNEQKSNLVFVLRPPYCNYFSSKFFEDSFSSILQDLGSSFISNAQLNYGKDNIEIDSIIKAADGSFVYVENKTTLNRYNIEGTMEKIEKFHSFVSREYPMLVFRYVIMAPYSHKNIEDGFRYFINKSTKKIERRDGINCGIYDFEVPIAKFDNVSLHCIVEPEYERMKAIVSDIIK